MLTPFPAVRSKTESTALSTSRSVRADMVTDALGEYTHLTLPMLLLVG